MHSLVVKGVSNYLFPSLEVILNLEKLVLIKSV